MDFANRSYQKELLDTNDVPFDAIKQNMYELNIINAKLGGHFITLNGFKKLLGKRKNILVCEIGCGGADNLIALKKWCDKKNIDAHFIGIDINESCIEYAKTKCDPQNFQLITSNYSNYLFPKNPDIIFSSLFCHHFTNEELTKMLRWQEANAAVGFFINDLHRNSFAYYSISWLTKIFSKSYLVKNDAPLSVLRGFKRKEWKSLLAKSGIWNYSLQWKWAFRWLIIVTNKNT